MTIYLPLGVQIDRVGNRIVITGSGELNQASADYFNNALSPIFGAKERLIELHLADLDIDDGVGLAVCLTAIKQWLANDCQLVIHQAPQMLAHNLYKNSLLRNPNRVSLVDVRQEEPYG